VAASSALTYVQIGTGAGSRPEGPAAGPPIVSGTVVDGSRRARSGLLVLLYLPIGLETKTPKSLFVGSTKTDGSGRFVISTQNTSTLKTVAAANDRWLNLDLLVTSSDLTLYRAAARTFTGTAWAGPEDIRKGSVDLGTLSLALGQPGVGPKKSSRSVQGAATCTETITFLSAANLGTIVGEVHTAVGSAHFNYGPTADSNIDAVVKVGTAAWSESVGTVHIGTSHDKALTFDAGAGQHRRLRTQFRYNKVKITNSCSGVRYTIKPVTWPTAATLTNASISDPSGGCGSSPYSSHKMSFSAGTSFTRNANAAKKWIPAVDLSPLSGPTSLAGARSGYSGNVWVKWSFPSKGTLCGDTAGPSSSARIGAGT